MLKEGEGIQTNLERLLWKEEGYRSKPYKCTAGRLTVGIGWNLDAGVSWELALMVLRSQIAELKRQLTARYRWFQGLNEARQAVVVSMAFQMGIAGFAGFKTTISLIEQGKYAAAATQMLTSKWAKQTPPRAKRHAEMMRTGKWPS